MVPSTNSVFGSGGRLIQTASGMLKGFGLTMPVVVPRRRYLHSHKIKFFWKEMMIFQRFEMTFRKVFVVSYMRSVQ